MRSLFAKVLLWFGALLVFSSMAFIATNSYMARRFSPMDEILGRLVPFQFMEVKTAYETGGRQALVETIARIEKFFPAKHYLLDRDGRDLATGEDRSDLLHAATPPRRPSLFPMFQRGGPRGVVRHIADGPYHWVVSVTWYRPDPFMEHLPYYGLILGALVLVCYALARSLARPLRELRLTLNRFGNGELSARTNSRRKDEFGQVSRAFDQMADRIQTLLTAERRLLQDVSHELRSPLARLEFAVELARTSGDRGAALDRVKRDVQRLTALVSELIEMTRAEGEPDGSNFAPILLSDLIEPLVDDCSIEADAKHCRILLHGNSNTRLQGHPELLRRALENVLRNAIRYSPQESAVDLTVQPNSHNVTIEIRDQGPGVPEELLADIFRPFVRAESDRSRDSGGVGLGLAIAQRAILLHHGEIAARNAHPGLAVTVTVPVAPEKLA